MQTDWQLLIKIVGFSSRRIKRSGYAYEAKNLEGITIFKGGASNGRKSCLLAVKDALVKAILKAKELGFSRILILSNNKRLV